MFDLILLYLLSTLNRKAAEKKGYAGTPWFWKTALAFIVGEFIGIFIYATSIILKNEKLEINQEFLASTHFLILNIFFLLCGIGGYLFIRKRLENKPHNKTDEFQNL